MSHFSFIDHISELPQEEITVLLRDFDEDDLEYAKGKAAALRDAGFGRKIYIRGLIEFTNICKNNCYYCGIRCENGAVRRYRLSKEDILQACERGYKEGFCTFVLQGGEDPYFTDERMAAIVSEIRERFPEAAITLSLGERSFESYEKLRKAGADRYLLRHETADRAHYERLHPASMSFENRMRCLRDLRTLGYQTGAGMMVGSPYQEPHHLAKDLVFLRTFHPEMVGLGPFLPEKDTPLGGFPAGSVETTLFLLSLVRLLLPDALIPSTTALHTAEANGRIRGLDAGANVIMPNITPEDARENYLLYDGKAGLRGDSVEALREIEEELRAAGYEISMSRGDYKGSV